MRLAVSLLVLGLVLAPRAVHAQPDGAWFDYTNERRFTGSSGAYAGWSDELVASGHYTVSAPADGPTVQVHGAYQWRYTSPESRETGHEDRAVDVDRSTRLYTTRTDLDEYDAQDPTAIATWVFVPTTLEVGDDVRILDDTFEVLETHALLELAGTTRTTIHLHHHEVGERHDAYGDFETRSSDDYWFDAATGMFLRELHTESDVGSTEGAAAGLDVFEEVRIVDASYAPHVGPVPPDPLLARPRAHVARTELSFPLIALMIGGAMLVVFLLIRRMSRPRPTLQIRGKPVVPRVLTAQEPLIALDAQVTATFAPFLPHFVDVARRTGNAVWIAESGSVTLGVAIDDKATGVASIFAREPDVCELLRRSLGRQDFFSEVRHGNLATVIEATSATGTKLPAGAAYNVLESYEVLALDAPGTPAYDTAVVSRLDDADVDAAATFLATVLGDSSDAYLKAALAAGDFAYVARVDGAIVGLGLATVAGTTGRLHTVAVAPAHRNKGLGRELVRARIRAMSTLGAKRIITEISALNSASLEIARGEGFVSIGAMFTETARDTAAAVATVATVRR